MFSILESSNKVDLSILEPFLITKFKPKVNKQNLFNTPILFCYPLGAREINSTRANSPDVR